MAMGWDDALLALGASLLANQAAKSGQQPGAPPTTPPPVGASAQPPGPFAQAGAANGPSPIGMALMMQQPGFPGGR